MNRLGLGVPWSEADLGRAGPAWKWGNAGCSHVEGRKVNSPWTSEGSSCRRMREVSTTWPKIYSYLMCRLLRPLLKYHWPALFAHLSGGDEKWRALGLNPDAWRLHPRIP